MTDLPDYVRAAVNLPAQKRRTWTSPYRPYDTKAYPRPRLEWAFLYGPSAAFAAMLALASEGPQGDPGTLVAGLAISLALLLPALWRVPQELKRGRHRTWTKDETQNTWTWADPSEEWELRPVPVGDAGPSAPVAGCARDAGRVVVGDHVNARRQWRVVPPLSARHRIARVPAPPPADHVSPGHLAAMVRYVRAQTASHRRQTLPALWPGRADLPLPGATSPSSSLARPLTGICLTRIPQVLCSPGGADLTWFWGVRVGLSVS